VDREILAQRLRGRGFIVMIDEKRRPFLPLATAPEPEEEENCDDQNTGNSSHDATNNGTDICS